jgi:hypothetical protein
MNNKLTQNEGFAWKWANLKMEKSTNFFRMGDQTCLKICRIEKLKKWFE